ncbi:sporulation protein [Virgibacillus natechei]|uniref:sporulation protein n=1 Tax=Virgibacillus sp. CBA3643 TaxID=2942278 RepID=UPI0035A261F7
MDYTLDYLRESLSNHMESDMCQQIVRKMEANKYENEEMFARDLSEGEMAYLNDVVESELNYARNARDDVRTKELTEVSELLF